MTDSKKDCFYLCQISLKDSKSTVSEGKRLASITSINFYTITKHFL